MKTRCLIVDDEPLARELIRGYAAKMENFEVVAECGDAMKALNTLRTKQIDLIFLDIQMPQINGIEFLKTLKHPPRVIITTAYHEFALDGFELDVVDYLLKPITFERFLKSVNRFYQMNQDTIQLINRQGGEKSSDDTFIYLKENKKVVKVYLADIKYIEGLSEYIQIYTDKRKVVVKASLAQMEEKLPSAQFLRIHKSYIVSVNRIEAFTAHTVEIQNKELPIGRSYKNVVPHLLNSSEDLGGE
jgi:DNA-binding LytR/AlgR family response regulator